MRIKELHPLRNTDRLAHGDFAANRTGQIGGYCSWYSVPFFHMLQSTAAIERAVFLIAKRGEHPF
jgi:hypothetical protein